MCRILLVLEDYNELLFLETLLKKLGFDVESIRNEVSLSEKIMGFSPDLIVATGDGHKINGLRVSQKIKKGRGTHTKLLLIFPRLKIQHDKVLDTVNADGILESPLNPRSVIASVCQLTGIPVEGVMSKFEKLPIAKDEPGGEGIQIISARVAPTKSQTVTGKQNPSPDHGKDDRASKYAEILKTAPKSKLNGFSRNFIQDQVKEIRRDENRPEIKKIDEERKAFVVALFKKKK